jgi:hypothetical protein
MPGVRCCATRRWCRATDGRSSDGGVLRAAVVFAVLMVFNSLFSFFAETNR